MKIALVLEHYAPHIGGAEKLFGDLARALVAQRFAVRVVTSSSGGVSGRTVSDGIETYHYGWPSLFGHPIARRADLAPHVEWADIVQTTQYTAAPAAVALAASRGKPCVFLAYEQLGPGWRRIESPARARVFEAFESWVFRKPYDRFVALSHATARDLVASGCDPRRIVTVHPVFNDFSEWRRIADQSAASRTFLYYGRPGRTKGVALLLDAIRAADRELAPEWRFELILSAEPSRDRRALVARARRYGLASRVRIGESVPEETLKQRLAAAYCVVVPSITEGFGFSAYQACCAGKPVIASDAGSLPEVVSGDCIVFRSGSVGALKDALLAASRGEFERREDRIERDGAQRMAALYESLAG